MSKTGVNHIYALVFCVMMVIGVGLATPRLFVLIHQYIIETKILPAQNIKIIDKEFNVILNGDSAMQTIIYYRFYPQITSDATAYQGRVAVTTQSKDKDFLKNNTSMWVLGKRDNKIQNILMNKIEYKSIDEMKQMCILNPTASSYCKYMQTLSDHGYKSMILVPVNRAADYSVIGYVLFIFDDLLPESDLQATVNRIKLHLSRIQPSLQYVQR